MSSARRSTSSCVGTLNTLGAIGGGEPSVTSACGWSEGRGPDRRLPAGTSDGSIMRGAPAFGGESFTEQRCTPQ